MLAGMGLYSHIVALAAAAVVGVTGHVLAAPPAPDSRPQTPETDVGLPQYSDAAVVAQSLAVDTITFRKLLHGCHTPLCNRLCPRCTFVGPQVSATGHCKKNGKLFNCRRAGNDGVKGNEGNEGDEGNEGNEGDEGDEGNEGRQRRPGRFAAKRRQRQVVQRSTRIFGMQRQQTHASAAADDGDDADTYFRAFENGVYVEEGPNIVVDYDIVLEFDMLGTPENYDGVTNDYAEGYGGDSDSEEAGAVVAETPGLAPGGDSEAGEGGDDGSSTNGARRLLSNA
eukprot:jgi/Ulvmu1/3378/UM157_0002.1